MGDTSQTLRLIWIDSYLQTRAPLTRRVMMDALGVSYDAATLDINEFVRRWPANIRYNPAAKFWHRNDPMIAPVFHGVDRRAVNDAFAAARNASKERNAA